MPTYLLLDASRLTLGFSWKSFSVRCLGTKLETLLRAICVVKHYLDRQTWTWQTRFSQHFKIKFVASTSETRSMEGWRGLKRKRKKGTPEVQAQHQPAVLEELVPPRVPEEIVASKLDVDMVLLPMPLGHVSSLSQFWSTHGPPMKVCLKGLGCTNPSIVLLPSFWSPQQEQSHKASKMMCRCLVARVDPVRASCVSSSNSPTCNNLLRPRNPPLLPRPKQASVGWTGFWTVTK